MLGFDVVFGAGGNFLKKAPSPGATYVSYGFFADLISETEILLRQQLIQLQCIMFELFRLSEATAAITDREQSPFCT